MALSHIGVDKEIANFDTESSEEARACRRFFDITRKIVLKETQWSFAREFAALALVDSDLDNGWGYSYRYPAACVDLIKLGYPGVTRTDYAFDFEDILLMPKVQYTMGKDAHGQLIFCNIIDAYASYTIDQEDTSRFTAGAELAMSYKLASLIVPRLSGGDFFKMKQDLMQYYMIELSNARRDDLLQNSSPCRPASELVKVRQW